MSRFEKLDPARQKRLLAAAADEFAGRGYEGASLARIGEAAGVSKASLYYYFDDKADLYAAVFRSAWAVLLPPEAAFHVEALDASSFWPELRRRYLALVERCRQEAWLVSAGTLFYDLAPAAGASERVAELQQRSQSFLGALIRRGQAVGVVRSDLPAGLLLEVVFAAAEAADRWMVRHWQELGEAEVAALAEPLFQLLQALAEPRGRGR